MSFLQRLIGSQGAKARCEYGDYFTNKLAVLPDVVKELLFEVGIYPDEAETFFGPMLCSVFPAFKNTEHEGLLLGLMHQHFPTIEDGNIQEALRLSGSSVDLSRARRQSEATQTITVEVKAVHGRDLIAKDRGGTSDPFLKLGLVYGEEGRIVGKDHTVKTGVVKKTLNPDWDEIITFRSTGVTFRALQNMFLRVECWDWNAIAADSFMGYATVRLVGLATSATHDVTLELKGRRMKADRVSGSVLLRVNWAAEAGQGIMHDSFTTSVEGDKAKKVKVKRIKSDKSDKSAEQRMEEEIRQLEKEEQIQRRLDTMGVEESRDFMKSTKRMIRRDTAAVVRRDGAAINMSQPTLLKHKPSRSAKRASVNTASPPRLDPAMMTPSKESRDSGDGAAEEEALGQELTKAKVTISRSEVMSTYIRSDPHTDYKNWEPVGKGGFGEVFSATHVESGKIVAFKVCEEPGEEVRAITINETWQLQQCSHENVIGWQTGYYFDNKVWFCDSGNLSEFLKMAPSLAEKHIGGILVQLMKGIQYLHGTGRLHRDIKPANVLLSKNGRIKIADLGLVLSSSEAEAVAGSAYWMAPEIVKMQKYNNKVDVFSIGAVAFTMIESSPPYSKYHPIKAKFRMATRGLAQMSSNPSSDLKDFILAATNQEPERRPSVEELLQHKFVKNNTCGRSELAAVFKSVFACDNLMGL